MPSDNIFNDSNSRSAQSRQEKINRQAAEKVAQQQAQNYNIAIQTNQALQVQLQQVLDQLKNATSQVNALTNQINQMTNTINDLTDQRDSLFKENLELNEKVSMLQSNDDLINEKVNEEDLRTIFKP